MTSGWTWARATQTKFSPKDHVRLSADTGNASLVFQQVSVPSSNDDDIFGFTSLVEPTQIKNIF